MFLFCIKNQIEQIVFNHYMKFRTADLYLDLAFCHHHLILQTLGSVHCRRQIVTSPFLLPCPSNFIRVIGTDTLTQCCSVMDRVKLRANTAFISSGILNVFQYGALHVRPGYHEEYENSPERYKGRSMLVSTPTPHNHENCPERYKGRSMLVSTPTPHNHENCPERYKGRSMLVSTLTPHTPENSPERYKGRSMLVSTSTRTPREVQGQEYAGKNIHENSPRDTRAGVCW